MDENGFLSLMRESSLFNSLNNDELLELKKIAFFQEIPQYVNVVNQGDYGDKFYFIISGDCEVYISNELGQEKLVTILSKGDYFGELAMLVDSYRFASVRTKSIVKVLYIYKSQFMHFLNSHLTFSHDLLFIVSKRLAKTLNILADNSKRIFIELISNEFSNNNKEKFIAYFKKICSYDVYLTPNNKLEELLKVHEHDRRNYYFLIDGPCNKRKDYTVNFIEQQPNEYYIPIDATQWALEHIARRITKKTIGLALASGGAPAMAHIGALAVFKMAHIPIDFIAGTSAGSLYGAVHAFDYSQDDVIASLTAQTKRFYASIVLLNACYNFSGVIKNNYLKKLFHPIFGNSKIEDALIPLGIVTSDLYSGNTIVLKEGNVVDAITASSAVPLLFEPVPYKEYLLVDGVATAPLPINVLCDEKIDFKIAVDIPQLDLVTSAKKRPGLPSVYLRSRSMMAQEIVNLNIRLANIIIKPEIGKAKLQDWKYSRQYIAAGVKAAKAIIPTIKEFLKK